MSTTMAILSCHFLSKAFTKVSKSCSNTWSNLLLMKKLMKLNSSLHCAQTRHKTNFFESVPFSAYMSLRPVQFVLVDDYIKDPDSFFNGLNILPGSSKNVVASSTDLLKHIHDIKTKQHNKTITDLHIDELLEDIDLEIFDESVPAAVDDQVAGECNVSSTTSPAANDETVKQIKSNFIIEDKAKTSEEWQACIDELHLVCSDYSIQILFRSLTEFFIDVAKLNSLTDLSLNKNWHKSSLVTSFINFLVQSNQNLEIAQPSLNIYLNYCIKNNDFETVVSLYNRVKSRVSVYGTEFLHTLIKGLSFSGNLEEAKALLHILNSYKDKLLIGHHQGLIIYAVGCFKSGKPSIALSIMLQLMQIKGVVISVLVKAFLAFFSYTNDADKWKENYEVVTSFFNWLHAHNVSLTSDAIQHIVVWFESIESENWKCATYSSNRIKRGECPITGNRLKQCNLSRNEFNYLEKSVSRILLQSSADDITLDFFKQDLTRDAALQLFHRTSMKDVRAFLEYLHDEGPFDLIVDGMNFAYTLNPYGDQKYFGKHRHKKSFHRMARIISEYTTAQSIKQKHVCIIFRKHLYDDVKVDGNFLLDVGNVYFAGNGIADDVLMLYGSIASGPQCRFASHDLFRNYRLIVAKNGDRKLLSLFDRYQSSRQIFCKGRGHKLYLTRGVSYEPEIQRTDTTWHFPYLCKEDKKSVGTYSKLLRHWLCVANTKATPTRFTLAEKINL